MLETLIFIVSLIAVIKGADWLGEASVDVAKRLGIPQLLIGATLVSIATTLPEIVISFFAGAAKESGIATGTVIGSPASNLGLIMGMIFLFTSIKPERGYFTRTLNIFIFLLALVLVMGLGGVISPIGGWVLIFLAIVYLALEFFISKSEESVVDEIETRFMKIKGFFNHRSGYKDVGLFILGATTLGIAARFLVDSATVIALDLNVPTFIVAATAIAFGTSIPEFVTGIHSIIRGRITLSLGNLIGASVLDLTIALGAGAIINPIIIDPKILILSTVSLFVISLMNLSTVLTKLPVDKIGIALIFTFFIFIMLLVSLDLTL